MIDDPLNDVACLALVTERAKVGVDQESVLYLARQFSSTRNLAAWIRRLPQRNDEGLANDGPKVACDVPQRVRIPAADPNCVERAAMYLAIAELIDPGPVRQLATMNTPGGRHTFAVEDDDPVHLDPLVTRNALEAGMCLMHPQSRPPPLSPQESTTWVMGLAAEPLRKAKETQRTLRNAVIAAAALEQGRALSHELASDLGLVIAVAEREAVLFGETGLDLVRQVLVRCEALLVRAHASIKNNVSPSSALTASSFEHIPSLVTKSSPCECEHKGSDSNDVRNGSWKIPSLKTLSGHVERGSRIAAPWAKMAVKLKLATWGVPPEVVDELDKQMFSGAAVSKDKNDDAKTSSVATPHGAVAAKTGASKKSSDHRFPLNVQISASSYPYYGMLVALTPRNGPGRD